MKKTILLLNALIVFSTILNAQVTRLANNINPSLFDLAPTVPISKSKAIVIEGGTFKIWVTGGKKDNTFPLSVPVTYDIYGGYLVTDGKMYFSGIGPSGSELWVTDGTNEGTRLVKDINTGNGSSTPHAMFLFNNKIFFYATTETYGDELWISDGTEAGTTMLADIFIGVSGSYGGLMFYASINNELYFTPVNNPLHQTYGAEYQLWKTNGSEQGTVKIASIGKSYKYYQPNFLVSYKDHLYFTGIDIENGKELWISDGTENGTHILKDINPGAGWSLIENPVIFNGVLLLAVSNDNQSRTLYASDGTGDGTRMLINADPNFNYSVNSTIINKKLLFQGISAETGFQLYLTDGTEPGTGLFNNITPASKWEDPRLLVPPGLYSSRFNTYFNEKLFKNKIFISCSHFENGKTTSTLWISDGTQKNTVIVKDFDNYLGHYFYDNDALYFSMNDGVHGNEIFKTRGKENSTEFFADVNPGPGSSDPVFLFELNNKIIFTAHDADSWMGDLYSIDKGHSNLPLSLLHFSATPFNNDVKLGWKTPGESISTFELQKSTDNKEFRSIGSLKSFEGSNAENEYNYLDPGALNDKGKILYYRLKWATNDNEITYSNIAIVKTGKAEINDLDLWPNPAGDFVKIAFTSLKNEDAQIRIIGNNGITVQTIKVHLSPGVNQQVIDLGKVSPGIYHADILIAGKVAGSKTFVKK